MPRLSNIQEIKKMEAASRKFIGEVVSMLNYNYGDNYRIEIEPKTKFAFELTLERKNKKDKEKFSAANVKGPSGIFKVAKMMSKVSR